MSKSTFYLHCPECCEPVFVRDADLFSDGETELCESCGTTVAVSCDSESPPEAVERRSAIEEIRRLRAEIERLNNHAHRWGAVEPVTDPVRVGQLQLAEDDRNDAEIRRLREECERLRTELAEANARASGWAAEAGSATRAAGLGDVEAAKLRAERDAALARAEELKRRESVWLTQLTETRDELSLERARAVQAEHRLVDEQQQSRAALAELGSTKAKLAMAERERDELRKIAVGRVARSHALTGHGLMVEARELLDLQRRLANSEAAIDSAMEQVADIMPAQCELERRLIVAEQEREEARDIASEWRERGWASACPELTGDMFPWEVGVGHGCRLADFVRRAALSEPTDALARIDTLSDEQLAAEAAQAMAERPEPHGDCQATQPKPREGAKR